MDLTLLSGVVRNRKMASAVSRTHIFDDPQAESQVQHNTIDRLRTYITKNSIFRKFSLRVHKFTFQWELAMHLIVCILSLTPFFFTGRRLFSLIPISVWAFYNVLFILGPQFSNKVIPRFGKLRLSFKTTIEEFFSPKLLPVLSISFLCVVLSLAVTGHRLGGPPLCYQPCGVCLATWSHAVPLPVGYTFTPSAVAAAVVNAVVSVSAPVSIQDPAYSPAAAAAQDPLLATGDPVVDAYRVGCGFANGKEMLGYYTMAQTSFILFFIVVVALTVCLAWRVAEEEKQERRSAEEWLKCENAHAHMLRTQLVEQLGAPGSSVRPEGSATWIYFGVTAALTFTLLGWHNWYVLPPSNTATLLIILNLLTILTGTLILHLSFFGRLLALYKRNLSRVECLSKILGTTAKEQLDSWWNCRSFVLNDDLSLDYDIGGLAVSATFLIAITLFAALIAQIYREGLQAMLEPPGSYLAYACMYITCCLIKLFTLATNTYEEQHRHIAVLQGVSNSLHYQGAMSTDYNEYAELKNSNTTSRPLSARVAEANSMWAVGSEDDYTGLHDDGPICIEDDEAPLLPPGAGLAGGGAGLSLDKPLLTRSSSGGTSSPRRTKGKGFASLSVDEKDPNKPPGILKTSSLSPVVNNWLGKTIFGSFRVGFEDAVNNEFMGEKDFFLESGYGGGGGVENNATGESGNGTENGYFPSGVTGVEMAAGNSSSLPRPHHTGSNSKDSASSNAGGRGVDSKGIALQVSTTEEDDVHAHNPDGAANHTSSGVGAGILRISPLGSTKSPHFATTVHINSVDSFSGVNVNTPEAPHEGGSHGGDGLSSGEGDGAGGGNAGAEGSAGSAVEDGTTVGGATGTSSSGSGSGLPPRPTLVRSVSHNASVESYRQAIAEMISQIRKYDPYPCILGIPVMPALFNSSKFYIFIGFMLIGMRVMVACLRQI